VEQRRTRRNQKPSPLEPSAQHKGESEDPTGLCMGRVGDSEFAATQIAVLEFPLARNVLCLNEMDESAVLQHRGLYFFVVCSV